MLDKPWLKNYPRGVPAEVDAHVYASLVDLFQKSIRKYRKLIAYSNMGQELSFKDLGEQAEAFAAYLIHVLGLKKGDRIAIMLPNILQYPIALFGALRAGLIVVNVNSQYTKPELQHQLVDSGARAIVVSTLSAHVLAEVLPHTRLQHVIMTRLGDMFPFPKSMIMNFVVKYIKKKELPWHIPTAIRFLDVVRRGRDLPRIDVTVAYDDIAFLQYTGGTTGISKGAMLTHGNMLSNVAQATAWLAPALDEAEEIIITPLPLYHIFSLMANCILFLAMGGHNVLITNPRDIPGFINELKKVKFTAMTGVNTLFNALLHYPGFAQLDFSSLKLVLGGGMAVRSSVAQEWHQVTGKPILEAYGLTETSPGVTVNPLTLRDYNGYVGLPLPSTDISIRGDKGETLDFNQAGELWVKGPQVMRGYWQRLDETEKVLDKSGWLKTGDIATLTEEGYIQIVDRKKDMIIVSGFNVYPNEIEDVVTAHPGVLEAAVIGVPDPGSGEAVKLYVVKKDPNLTSDEIIKFCRKSLTGYKIPHQVEFRSELPKSNIGKVLRRELREKACV